MQDGVNLIKRLLGSAVRRRALLWLAVVLPWIVLLSIPGVLLALAWVAWDYYRLQQRVQRDWTRWLDGTVPALEDSSALLIAAVSPMAQLQRRRLLARLNDTLRDEVVSEIAAARVRRFDPRWFAQSAALALALFGWQQAGKPQPAPQKNNAVAPVIKKSNEIVVRVAPPRYTGVARSEGAARDLTVPQNSVVEWCLEKPQSVDTPVELSDGKMLKIGRECARWNAAESIFWRWRGQRYTLKVVPDQAPVVAFSAPRDMLQVLAADAGSARIAVSVRDDYQVKRATMHLTLARGSGENIRFSDREVPLPQSSNPRAREWSRQWTLAELGMEPGDELYFFVRASDNAEPQQTTTSPTYTLRLPGPVEEQDESNALPMLVKPENLRRQRQIIIDTEQLVADLKANPRLGTVRARSEAIAGDQAMLRRRYGQFLGEESTLFGDDDDHEEEGSPLDVVAQYGHKHDQEGSATIFDEGTKKLLRRALGAMWDAEKALRAITPKPALAPEYKALEAIKELQQADRIYLHKTAFTPPAIKEEIRMTGDIKDAKSYRREQGGPGEDVPVKMRILMQALASSGPLPVLWQRSAQEWIGARIVNDDQRLEAQKAVQDVADGCATCRPVLRAWLRGAIINAPVLLQARPVAETPFTRAFGRPTR